jgi:hypothetical protein
MTYKIPFEEKQAKYILKHFKDCKIIDIPGSTYTWIELEIKGAYDLIDLYSCGVLYGLNLTTNKNKQS